MSVAMNIWYAKPLGDGIWAPVPSVEIEKLFQPFFETAGTPVGTGVSRPAQGETPAM